MGAIEIVNFKISLLKKLAEKEELPVSKKENLKKVLDSLDRYVDLKVLPEATLFELALAMEDLKETLILPSNYDEIKVELWEIITRNPPPTTKATL